MDKFLEQLKQIKDTFEWSINKYGQIRGRLKNINCGCCNIDYCPITAVHRIQKEQSLNINQYIIAAKQINLKRPMADYIVTISDIAINKTQYLHLIINELTNNYPKNEYINLNVCKEDRLKLLGILGLTEQHNYENF